MKRELTPDEKQQVAMALILLKDWKTGPKFDIAKAMYVVKLAQALEVEIEYDRLLPLIPPMKIEPR